MCRWVCGVKVILARSEVARERSMLREEGERSKSTSPQLGLCKTRSQNDCFYLWACLRLPLLRRSPNPLTLVHRRLSSNRLLARVCLPVCVSVSGLVHQNTCALCAHTHTHTHKHSAASPTPFMINPPCSLSLALPACVHARVLDIVLFCLFVFVRWCHSFRDAGPFPSERVRVCVCPCRVSFQCPYRHTREQDT